MARKTLLKNRKKHKLLKDSRLIALLAIIAVLAIFALSSPAIIGFFTAEEKVVQQNLDYVITESGEYDWFLSEYDINSTLTSASISGSVVGPGEAKVWLVTSTGDFLLMYDSSQAHFTISPIVGFQAAVNAGGKPDVPPGLEKKLLPEENLTEGNQSEPSSDGSGEMNISPGITEPEQPPSEEIPLDNVTVPEENITAPEENVTTPENETLEIPENLTQPEENIPIPPEPVPETNVRTFENACVSTCSLAGISGLQNDVLTLLIEIDADTTLLLDSITYTLQLPEVVPAATNITNETVFFTTEILDAENKSIDAVVEFIDPDTEETKAVGRSEKKEGRFGVSVEEKPKVHLPKGRYEIKVKPQNNTVQEIIISDVNIQDNVTEFIRIDDPPDSSVYTQLYAIDPTSINFTSATVTVTAEGDTLWKCKDWNFETRECWNGEYEEWAPLQSITPGQPYTFVLTPEDPAFGEISDSVGESNTTSTTYVNKTFLTLNVTNASTFLFLASAELRSDSTAQSIRVRMLIDDVDQGNASYRPDSSDSYETWISHKTANLSTGIHTAAIQFATSGATTFIRNARLTAIALNESFSNETNASRAMVAGTSFRTEQVLTFTPSSAGEYLIIATAEDGPYGGNNHLAHMNATLDGTTLDLVTHQSKGAAMQKWFGAHTTANFTTVAPHTVAIGARANTGDAAQIQRTRITAIRLRGFADQILANESATERNTSSTTFAEAVSFAFNLGTLADFLFIATADISNAQAIASDNVEAKLQIDGVDYGLESYEPVGSSDFVTFATTQNVSLSAGAHNASFQFRSISGGTVFMRNVHLSAFSVIPLVVQTPNVTFVAPTDANNSLVARNYTFINTTVTSNAAITSCTLEFDSANQSATIVGTGSSVSCFVNKTAADGNHAYRMYATAGSTTGVSETRVVRFDSTRPQVQFVSPTPENNTIVSGIQIINVTASDANFANITIFNETSIVQTCLTQVCEFTWITTQYTDGLHFFNATAFDTFGNFNSTETRQYNVSNVADTAPPTIILVSPTPANNSFVSSTSATINATVTDASGVRICVLEFDSTNETMTQTGNTSSVCTTAKASLAQGIHNFTVFANDTVNNTGSSGKSFFTVDTISPQVQFVSPTETSGSLISRNFVLTNVTATDANLLNITIRLFNASGLVNSSTSLSSPNFVNFTGLADGTYFFNATATDLAGNANITETRNVTIDTASPQVQFVAPTETSGAFLGRNYIQVNVTAADANFANVTIRLFNSSGQVSSITNTTTIAFNNFTGLSDGSYFFNATAMDNAGNSNSTETRNVTINTASPQIQFVNPTETSGSYISRNNIRTNVTVIDSTFANVTTRLFNSTGLVGNITNTTTTAFNNFTNLADGLYRFNATAFDQAGNSNSTETRNVTIDTIAPQVQFVSPTPANNSVVNGTQTINVTASDANFKNITIFEDGSTVQTCTTTVCEFTWDTTTDTDGIHRFNATAFDLAGNSNSTETRQFNVSNAGPDIIFVAPTPANGSFVTSTSATINVTVSSSTAVDTCVLTFDSVNETMTKVGAGTSVVCTTTKPGLADGAHTFSVRANDSSALNGTTSTRTFTVDTASPQVQFVSPTTAAGNFTQNFITANVTATDTNLGTITLRLYNSTSIVQTNTSSSSPLFVNITGLADGTYFLNATANDSAGNSNQTETSTILLDNAAPQMQFVSPTETSGTFQSRSYIQVNVTATDTNFKNVTIRLFNSTGLVAAITNTSTIAFNNFTGLADGFYTFNATAFDHSGNSNSTETRNITLDATNPQTQFVAPTETSGSLLTRNNILVNVTASDTNFANITTRLFNSSGLVSAIINTTATAFNNFTNLPDGTYFFNASTIDLAGNTNSTETRNVTIDTAAPVVTFVAPTFANNSVVNGSGFFVNATAVDALSSIDACTLQLDTTNFSMTKTGSGTSVVCSRNNTGLTNGTHTYKVFANDTAGKVGASETRTILLNFTDVDNDGLTDAGDPILFNENNVTATGVTNLNITVDGNNSADGFADFDVHTLTMFDGTTPMLNLTHNFSINIIDLSKITIEKAANSIVINMSGQLAAGENKSLFIEDNSFVELCVKDAEISSVSAFSADCTGTNETVFDSCLGNSTGVTINNITCVDSGTLIDVSGLKFSGIRGTPSAAAPPAAAPSPAAPSGPAAPITLPVIPVLPTPPVVIPPIVIPPLPPIEAFFEPPIRNIVIAAAFILFLLFIIARRKEARETGIIVEHKLLKGASPVRRYFAAWKRERKEAADETEHATAAIARRLAREGEYYSGRFAHLKRSAKAYSAGIRNEWAGTARFYGGLVKSAKRNISEEIRERRELAKKAVMEERRKAREQDERRIQAEELQRKREEIRKRKAQQMFAHTINAIKRNLRKEKTRYVEFYGPQIKDIREKLAERRAAKEELSRRHAAEIKKKQRELAEKQKHYEESARVHEELAAEEKLRQEKAEDRKIREAARHRKELGRKLESERAAIKKLLRTEGKHYAKAYSKTAEALGKGLEHYKKSYGSAKRTAGQKIREEKRYYEKFYEPQIREMREKLKERKRLAEDMRKKQLEEADRRRAAHARALRHYKNIIGNRLRKTKQYYKEFYGPQIEELKEKLEKRRRQISEENRIRLEGLREEQAKREEEKRQKLEELRARQAEIDEKRKKFMEKVRAERERIEAVKRKSLEEAKKKREEARRKWSEIKKKSLEEHRLHKRHLHKKKREK